MAEGASNLKGPFRNRTLVSDQEAEDRLWKWVSFAGLLHAVLILSLFVIPYGLSDRKTSYPVYTVDLVGGEKLGGGGVGSMETSAPTPAKPKQEPKKTKAESSPRTQPAKAQAVKKEKSKAKAAEKPIQTQQKTAMNELKSKELKQKEAKNETPPERAVSGQVREKLIESALDRIKERAQAEQTTKKAGGIASGAGTGDGQGAVAPGSGGQGGGIVKGFEFIVYRNRVQNLIKERWVWVGKRNDLEVTVHFGITESGEVVGLRLVRASGDQSFDSSVFRAIKSASPLPPPPESYRKDFSDVELTFQPKDLGGGKG